MARIGVTYNDVKQTAIKLLSQGIAPSVQKVREVLGTGSHTTIAEHLGIWREEHASKAIHHLPANMPKELISTFEVLWQTAMEHAEKQLAAIKADLNAQQEKMQQEKAVTEQTLADLKTTLAQTNQKLDEKTNQMQSLQTELAVTQERLSNQAEEKDILKSQYEDRLKHGYNDQHSLREKSETLQANIKELQQQLAEQTEKHQANLAQARQLQEQSESRWLKLIDQARTESKETQKNYETRLDKQYKQIEMLQNLGEDLKSKAIVQQSALKHEQALAVDLKAQLNKLQHNYNEAITEMAVLKTKLANTAQEKTAKKSGPKQNN